jgi:hypothetical protein
MRHRKGGNVFTNAWAELKSRLPGAKAREEAAQGEAAAAAEKTRTEGVQPTTYADPTPPSTASSSSAFYTGRPAMAFGGRKTSKIGKTFDRCVKAVRKTVRARKGSTKESAAIAICTKSVLQTRGRTLKRYTKGRLTTQKKVRGGRS